MCLVLLKNISKFISNKTFTEFLYSLDTPAYVYHFDIIKYIFDNIKEEMRAIKNLKIYYAVKANSNFEILQFLHSLIDGVDVASIYEYKQVKHIFGDKEISITGPSFLEEDIEGFYKSNLIFDFNSISQLENCKEIVSNKAIGIRMNIPYNYKKNEVDSRFGISLEDDRLFELLEEFNAKIVKIHVHNGEKDEIFFRNLRNQLNILEGRKLLSDIQEVNLGGGLLDLIMKGDLPWLMKEIQNIQKDYFRDENVNFVIEPGSALVNLCGFLITKVISADYSKDIRNIVVNTSSYNLNHWFKPKLLTHTSKKQTTFKTNIYGTTCYEGDYFCLDKLIKELNIEDKLLFFPVGGYSKSNHTKLHGLPFPAEYYFNENFLYEGDKHESNIIKSKG